MKKKLAKWIGSLILISMILTSVCPLSVLAADEPAPPAETTVITETETPQETLQETPQETPAKTTEPQVTEVPAAGDTAGSQTITGETDLEKETNTVLNASEEGIVAGGEKATNPDEKKDESEKLPENPDEKKEDADGTDSQDADKKEGELNEKKAEESEIQEKVDETVKVEATRGESNAGEKAEEEKKDNVPAEALFDNSTDVADGTYVPDGTTVTVVNPKDKSGKDNFEIRQITVKNGKATATMYSVSEKMTHIYVGSNADISAAEEDLVDGSGNLVTNVYAITGQLVEIPVKLNGGSVAIKTRTTAMSSPRWTSNSYMITITEPETPAEEPFDNSTDVADGTYVPDGTTVTVVNPKDKSGKDNFEIRQITVKNGKATATMYSVSEKMTHIYVGSNADISAAEEDLVDGSGNLVTNVYAITGQLVEIPVKLNGGSVAIKTRTTAMSSPRWTSNSYMITITEPETPAEEPFDNSTDVADGTYTADDENVTFTPPTSARVTFTIEKVIVENGKATAVMTTTSGTQTHVYVGSNEEIPVAEEALVDGSGNLITNVYAISDKMFTIPVKVNADGSLKIRTTSMGGTWTGYTYKIEITEAVQPKEADYSAVEAAKAKVPNDLSVYTEKSVAKLQTALDAVVEGKKADEQATVDGWAKAIEDAVAGLEKKDGTPVPFDELTDGTYTATLECKSSMFPVGTACTVIVKDGKFDTIIKMKKASNTAQTIVFLGKADAAPANESSWIYHGTDENGIYTFKLTNVPIGKPFDLAAYSVNTNKWYDRQLMIDKDSFIKGEGQAPADDGSSDSKNDQQEITVLDGGTAAVDNSTTLPDGVYTPDSFAFSGGSGRATISCRSVTVTKGRAYATIAFSSTNYGYVKAAGGVYYPSIEGGESVFTIPIQLNANNTIIGMTTAMSQAHEVTYTIYVYIEAAGAGALSGGEEIKLEHAELLKMFRYDNGCVLVEIDRTKDTVLDPEKLAKETKENKDEAAQNETAPTKETAEAVEEEGGQSNVKTDADYAMELYQADVVKYLIVPEGVEIPAGMEKQVLVIRLPKDSVYVSSEDEAEAMESLGLLELIKATGLTEENCKNEALKNLLKDGKVVSTGEIDDVDYNKLVKAEADLVLGAGGDILPKEAEKDKKAKDYQDQYTKITERMALLDIPMLIDRSADEKDPKGQLEWLKLYGILFGKEKEADALIAKGVQ